MRALLAIVVLVFSLSGQASGEEMAQVGDVMIHEAWARASLGETKNSAAYMTLEIVSDEADRLIAADCAVAKSAELHTHLMESGIAKMRPVDAIEVSPGEPTILEPGGLHVMLVGLKETLVEGETIALSLTFEKAGAVEVVVPIKGIGGGMQHGHGEHSKKMTN